MAMRFLVLSQVIGRISIRMSETIVNLGTCRLVLPWDAARATRWGGRPYGVINCRFPHKAGSMVSIRWSQLAGQSGADAR